MDNTQEDYYIGNRSFSSKDKAIRMTRKRAKRVAYGMYDKFGFLPSFYTIIHLKHKPPRPECVGKNIIMKWKMFLRTNGRWSISHLCDDNNKCACGWEYTPKEYTEIKEFGTMPDIACASCENSESDNSSVRWANLQTRISN